MLPENLRENSVASAVAASAPDAIASGKIDHGELTLEIRPEKIAAVCAILKHQLSFVRLSDVTAVDWYPREPRFEVVYHLHSLETNSRLRLKCPLNSEAAEIDSVTGVWRSANWYEREVFDLFGIRFRNHPDLKRIMMPDDWEGHPLRKDYPVHGYRYEYQNE
ncbi:MAG TPA: NADH-quinone oxidoreductase subunit C [Bryobacteraceae bacterium]|nr:NADH-quinone oxidoreductase subunit C [Bryobacteraceae bacterium]